MACTVAPFDMVRTYIKCSALHVSMCMSTGTHVISGAFIVASCQSYRVLFNQYHDALYPSSSNLSEQNQMLSYVISFLSFFQVRTRLMNQPADARLYTGAIDCFVKLIKKDGVKGLYAGENEQFRGTQRRKGTGRDRGEMN